LRVVLDMEDAIERGLAIFLAILVVLMFVLFFNILAFFPMHQLP
jgi:hypothetical protein